MTWKGATWKDRGLCPPGMVEALSGQLIADQRAAAGAALARRASPAGGAGRPPAPLPPHPPTPARAHLSAPPRGDHGRSGETPGGGGEGKSAPRAPGRGTAT
jgi:hypothetical protein